MTEGQDHETTDRQTNIRRVQKQLATRPSVVTVPDNLLLLLESWFAIGMTCAKWHNVWSRWFRLSYGIRQGGVLSPYLFAV